MATTTLLVLGVKGMAMEILVQGRFNASSGMDLVVNRLTLINN